MLVGDSVKLSLSFWLLSMLRKHGVQAICRFLDFSGAEDLEAVLLRAYERDPSA